MDSKIVYQKAALRMLDNLVKYYGDEDHAILRRLQDGLNIQKQQAEQMLAKYKQDSR